MGEEMIAPKGIIPSDALMIIEKLKDGHDVDIEDFERDLFFARERQIDFSRLNKELENVRSEFPVEPSRTDGANFDRCAAEVVHRNLPLDEGLAGARDFWIWLSLRFADDVIRWRHGESGEPAHPNNYAINNKLDGLLPRLWFRAELTLVHGANDPYELTRRGLEVDFWASGIIRPRYASCRPLTRAFVKYQYRDERPETPYLHHTSDDGVRMLYKRLKRIHATVALEMLDEDAAFSLVSELAEGLRTNKTDEVSSTPGSSA